MFPPHHHYVPLLKWKRGEQHAVRSISGHAKSRVTPLIEFVTVPVDLKTRQPKKTLSAHIDDSLDAIASNWGNSAAVFVDPAEVSALGGAAMAFAGAHARGLNFVPVTGISRPIAERNAAVSHAQRGLCIRISPSDLLNTSLPLDINAFAEAHRLIMSSVDIVVDLGSMQKQNTFFIVSAATSAMQMIPSIAQWRTLTVVASSFPTHMGGVPRQGSMLVDRTDFAAWQALHARRSLLPRLPTFGDYGIQHPAGVEGYDPRYMPMSAAIRYTLDTQWLLIKGQSQKKQSLKMQYPILAKLLAGSTHYRGHNHCVGCSHVHACASNRPGFGSPESWRRIGTTHHLEVVTAQLAGVSYP